jgi:Zn-dependent protease with chaperone function
VTQQPARSRATLTDISSRAWEHPADQGALVALRKLKGFDTVLKAMSGLFNERAVRLVFLGSAVRADERQFPRLHQLLGEVGRTLDAPELPELYVVANPVPAAITIGMNKPFVVLNSGLVDLLDEEELRFVIAHELGHAMSGPASRSAASACARSWRRCTSGRASPSSLLTVPGCSRPRTRPPRSACT